MQTSQYEIEKVDETAEYAQKSKHDTILKKKKFQLLFVIIGSILSFENVKFLRKRHEFFKCQLSTYNFFRWHVQLLVFRQIADPVVHGYSADNDVHEESHKVHYEFLQ